jgi:hypothetical protein
MVVTTARMPIMIPNAVRTPLVLFALMAERAILKDSTFS